MESSKFTESFPILGIFHKDANPDDKEKGTPIAIDVTNIYDIYVDFYCEDSSLRKYRKRTRIKNNKEYYYVQESVEDCMKIIKESWKDAIDIVNKLKINESYNGEQL